MYNFESAENFIQKFSKDIIKSTENLFLDQLNEFVSRGLIIVEITEPVLCQSVTTDKIEIRQSCRLLLKDQEYIKKLEAENSALLKQLNKIQEAITVSVTLQG